MDDGVLEAVTIKHFAAGAFHEGTWFLRWQFLTSIPVCTENLIRVDDVMESPKLAE